MQMTVRQTLWPRYRSVLLGAAFALSTLPAGVLALPIVLYLPTCPCNAQLSPMILLVPVLPLIAGVTFAAAFRTNERWSTIGVYGLLLGVAGAMYVGLLTSVSFAVSSEYVSAPYRAYAVAYLVMISVLAVSGTRSLLEQRDRVSTALAVAAAATIVVAVAGAAARGELVAAGTASAAAVTGALVPVAVIRNVLRLRVSAALIAGFIAVVSFGMRVAFGLQALTRLGPGRPFTLASDDGDSYYAGALTVLNEADGLQLALTNTWFPPGYTMFLATALGPGEDFARVIIAQAALAGLATFFVYLIARSVVSPRLALMAAALFALDVDLIGASATLTAEALLLPLLLLALLGLIRYERSRVFGWLLVSAASVALAYMTRNLALVLVVAAVVWLVTLQWRMPRLLARDVATITIAVLLATVPTALATGQSGALRLTNQSAIVAFDTPVNGVTIDNQELLSHGIHLTKDPVLGAVRLLADPLFTLSFFSRAIPNRVSTLLFSPSNGTFDPLTIVNAAYFPSAFGQLVALIGVGLVAVAIVLFFVRKVYARRPAATLLALFAGLYVAVFALVFLPSHPYRYRLPVEPVMYVAEVAALGYLIRRIRVMIRR